MFVGRNAAAGEKVPRILIAVMIAVAAFLLVRNWGLYPTVMDDEHAYSKFARLLPLSQAGFPDYLYYVVYRATSLCGGGFLDCVRGLNALFFALAAPFIYLTGLRLAGKKTALAVAMLSLLAPLNGYTAYFMPESMYFFFFWAFTWRLFGSRDAHAQPRTPRDWKWLGVVFGLLALVKPHALFMLPALAVLFFLLPREGEDGTMAQRLKPVAAFLFFALAVKFAAGFAVAGKSGLTLLGSVYAKLIPGPSYYFNLVRLALENLHGHLLVLCLLFPVPVALLLLSVRQAFRRPAGADFPVPAFASLYALAVLSSLLVMTAFVTASAIGSGPFETIARLHLRYYSFAFPLLYFVAAAQFSSGSHGFPVVPARWRALAAVPVGAAILYAMETKLASYTPNFVDSPDLRGLMMRPAAIQVWAAFSLAVLVAWIARPRLGGRIFVFVFLPLSLLCATTTTHLELRKRLVPDLYDRAGVSAAKFLAGVRTERFPHVLVVGADLTGLYRTMFQLDNPAAVGETVASIDTGANPAVSKKHLDESEWLMVIGDHPLPQGTYAHYPQDGYTLVNLGGPGIVDFTKESWPGLVAGARGFLPAEPWGTWAIGNVTLEFVKPLPEKFALHLWAFTFGPFVGREYSVHVGNSTKTFRLGAATKEKRMIEFDNPDGAKTLTIDIPATVSPKALGLGDDDRQLGVAFIEVGIYPRSVKW